MHRVQASEDTTDNCTLLIQLCLNLKSFKTFTLWDALLSWKCLHVFLSTWTVCSTHKYFFLRLRHFTMTNTKQKTDTSIITVPLMPPPAIRVRHNGWPCGWRCLQQRWKTEDSYICIQGSDSERVGDRLGFGTVICCSLTWVLHLLKSICYTQMWIIMKHVLDACTMNGLKLSSALFKIVKILYAWGTLLFNS